LAFLALARPPGGIIGRGKIRYPPSPVAPRCFDHDFEACIAHLRLPVTHRRSTRTTNLIERLFGEERRRLKFVPNAFGEKPVIRAAESWRGLRFHRIRAAWTPTTRPRSPDQTGHLAREFPASPRLDPRAIRHRPRSIMKSPRTRLLCRVVPFRHFGIAVLGPKGGKLVGVLELEEATRLTAKPFLSVLAKVFSAFGCSSLDWHQFLLFDGNAGGRALSGVTSASKSSSRIMRQNPNASPARLRSPAGA
jgi:hypothetical protein